jgi:hypothetical protein
MDYPDIHPYVAEKILEKGIPTNVNQGLFVDNADSDDPNARTSLFLPWYVTPNPDTHVKDDEVINPICVVLDNVAVEERNYVYAANPDGSPGLRYIEYSQPGREITIGFPRLDTPFPVGDLCEDIGLELSYFDDFVVSFLMSHGEDRLGISASKGFPIVSLLSNIEREECPACLLFLDKGTLTDFHDDGEHYKSLTFPSTISAVLESATLKDNEVYRVDDSRRLFYDTGISRIVPRKSSDSITHFSYNKDTQTAYFQIDGVEYQVPPNGSTPPLPPDYQYFSKDNARGVELLDEDEVSVQKWYIDYLDPENGDPGKAPTFTHHYIKRINKTWYIYQSQDVVELDPVNKDRLNIHKGEMITIQIMYAGDPGTALINEELFQKHTGVGNFPATMICEIREEDIHYRITKEIPSSKPLLWTFPPHLRRLGAPVSGIEGTQDINTLQYGQLKYFSLDTPDYILMPNIDIDKLNPTSLSEGTTNFSTLVMEDSEILGRLMKKWWNEKREIKDTGRLLFEVSRAIHYLSISGSQFVGDLVRELVDFMRRSVNSIHGFSFGREEKYRGLVPVGETFLYNEHHHIYGYWFYALATLYHYGKKIESLGENAKSILYQMIVSVANPTTDEMGVKVRNKDFYGGHSWEWGLSSLWFNTLSRIGESVNCYYSLMLLGLHHDPGLPFTQTERYNIGKHCALMEITALDCYFRNSQSLLGVDSHITGELNAHGRSILEAPKYENTFNAAIVSIVSNQVSPYSEFQYSYLTRYNNFWLDEMKNSTNYGMTSRLLSSILQGKYFPVEGEPDTPIPLRTLAVNALLLGFSSVGYIEGGELKLFVGFAKEAIEAEPDIAPLEDIPPVRVSRSDVYYWSRQRLDLKLFLPSPPVEEPHVPVRMGGAHTTLFDEFWFWALVGVVIAITIGFVAAFARRSKI